MDMEWVYVGNPGNAPDIHKPKGWQFGFGRVDYEYRIGKYEVTSGQWVEFLNSVAVTDDPHGLYNPEMWDGYESPRIERIGGAGDYAYQVAPDWANRPAIYISFWDMTRFANWMHNGQGNGDTETGAYTLNGYNGDDGRLIHRNPDATVWLPSEDEWYKAAYYDGEGDVYYDFPTGTDAWPSNDLIDPDPGNNATFRASGSDVTLGRPYWRTEVGEFENSPSPYGTFDQGGNVYERNEVIIGPRRGARGGGEYSDHIRLMAGYRADVPVLTEGVGSGFRLAAALPAPGDINGDGFVDRRDVVALLSRSSPASLPELSIVQANLGVDIPSHVSAVPEPSSFVLFVLGITLIIIILAAGSRDDCR